MARICPLFSGSSGNATLIKEDNFSFLIDAGVSFKRLCSAINSVGANAQDICGIAVTHEHTDHIAGLNVLLKNLKVPLFASKETLDTLKGKNILPVSAECVAVDGDFLLENALLHRFKTSHDCNGSSGYSLILPSGKKVTVCTDLGVVTNEVRGALKGSDCVLIEANHDVEMLKRGPYPPETKIRILSELGHLSNIACATELPQLLKEGTTRFILGHLSRHNNLPALAVSAAKATFADVGAVRDKDYILSVAKPEGGDVTII